MTDFKDTVSAYGISEIRVPVRLREVSAAMDYLEKRGRKITKHSVAALLRSAASEGLFDFMTEVATGEAE